MGTVLHTNTMLHIAELKVRNTIKRMAARKDFQLQRRFLHFMRPLNIARTFADAL
jgi:hypothetical protein